MAERGQYVVASGAWGPAEQAAMERCLALPGLALRPVEPVRPVRLSRTIEAEIIPRLLLAHRMVAEPDVARVTAGDVAQFAGLSLSDNRAAAMDYVEAMLARDLPIEAVFLDLLAPAARLLGDMWREDLCSFADVTVGLSRMQQILRVLAPSFEDEEQGSCPGRILVAPVPGEQHSFGASMLEAFFRRAGWEVAGGPLPSRELISAVRRDWFDVVGLSLGSDVLFEGLHGLVRSIRAASRNPSLAIMLGGRYFIDHPERAAEVDADSVATDAPDALRQAQAFVGMVVRC